jgi:hypothetical protein
VRAGRPALPASERERLARPMAFPSSLYVAFDRDRMRRRGVLFPDEPGVRLSR